MRISTILRKAKSIKNCLAPINQLPSETLAHIVTFLPTERGLINAAVVCQHWRMSLLSSPRLWWNAGGSSSEIQAYIERSKFTPIDAKISSPELAELIGPHASRLAGLTLLLDDPHGLSQILKHLHYPIPTLHVFRIIAYAPRLHTLEFPSVLQNPFFLHSKKLEIKRISAFIGPQTFPHVTEVTLHTTTYPLRPMGSFLSTLEQFPVLEGVYITFHADLCTDPTPYLVTLPHVQEMSLSGSSRVRMSVRIPHLLEFLYLPGLRSLSLRAMPKLVTFRPVFPITPLGEHLPNLAELPELRVTLGMSFGEATFRGPSQATLGYLTGPFSSYSQHEGLLWEGLPLHSVRRLTVNTVFPPSDQELEWLIELLRDLKFLEDLEFRGECGRALGRLRHSMAREAIFLCLQTLTVHRGERERREVLRLKHLFDAAGLNVTLIYTPDPGAQEGREAETDADGSG